MAKVRVGLLGCGGFMGEHVRRLSANADAQIVALCDTTEQMTRAFAQKNAPKDGWPTELMHFTDPAQMYAQAKLDGVFIATPHTLHFAHGTQALLAGVHVYMEKPMVTAAGDASAIAQTAKQTGKILVVGYNTPCSPEFSFIRDAIRSKRYGKLELVTGYLAQGWRNATVGLWRQKPELSGGGQAYDSGAHLLNSLVWSVESSIDTVHAFVDNVGTPVDINSSINIRFENGVFAAIVVSGNCPASGAHMSFIFDNGRIDVDPWGAGWMGVHGPRGQEKYPPVTGAYQTPDDNFIDAILGRAEPRTSATNGIVQSELMDAIYESARTGLPAKPKRR